MSAATRKTVVLGAEHDERLRAIVEDVLEAVSATRPREGWAMAGSQELVTLDVEIDGRPLHVEAETYIGLSISGPAELVDRVVALIDQRR